MAVGLEYISLIVPIEKIEEHYPGGFEKYKSDNQESIGKSIWYDDYLLRDGAMNKYDIGALVEEWESYGLKGVIEVDGKKNWKDICVVDNFAGPTLPCAWLKSKDSSVAHVNDDSKIVIHRNNFWDGQVNFFKPLEWLKQFRSAVKSQNRLDLRKLRKEVFQQTVHIVNKGMYSLNGVNIQLDNSRIAEETVFYTKPEKLTPTDSEINTEFAVLEADCIETAQLLQKAGYNVCMLNMANRQNPGGGVSGGAGAQEENIFRRSNLLLSLYQFVDYADQYGVKQHEKNIYPLDRNSGGIYSKDTTIFRGSENSGYCLLKTPFNNEPEFVNQFKLVVFAIIDDHNAWREHNPEGNVLPFEKVFG